MNIYKSDGGLEIGENAEQVRGIEARDGFGSFRRRLE
jgi:hypothetical protein